MSAYDRPASTIRRDRGARSSATEPGAPARTSHPLAVTPVPGRVLPAPRTTGEALPTPILERLRTGADLDLSDVRVHRNSTAPAAIGARAFTRGADIHLAPGREDLLGHEAWHVVQQRQGRVSPTTRLRGIPVNLDDRLEDEADRMTGPTVPSAQPSPVVDVLQGNFELTSTTFRGLLTEQPDDQNAVKDGYAQGSYTTVGFEHEFAQMPKDGPLTGVSHVELAESAEKMPLTGLPFLLETDADRALELVSPPFTVATLPGTMIPHAGHVRRIDAMIQQRLTAMIADKPTFTKLVERFGTDPGLTFTYQDATVEPENIGPETAIDYHQGNASVAAASIGSMVISPSLKSTGNVTTPTISGQVNFATDLATFERARGSTDAKDLGEFAQPFAALERKLHVLLTDAHGKSRAAAVQSPRLTQYLRILARTLSQQLAVPSIEAARSRQEKYFVNESAVERSQMRNNASDNEAHRFHRKMASHVKDVGDAWLKDTPLNVGLGLLDHLDWYAVGVISAWPDLRSAILKLPPGSYFSGANRGWYELCFRDALQLIDYTLTRITASAQKYTGRLDTSNEYAEPAERPGFLGHDMTHLGARQDTYISGPKAQLLGHDGPRLHVVETRSSDALGVTDRLHIDHRIQTAVGELTDAVLAAELGHDGTDKVKAHRDAQITAALRAGGQTQKQIATALKVPQNRVNALSQKL